MRQSISYITKWRERKYRELIKQNNKEAIEKYIRQQLRRKKSIQQILNEINTLNPSLTQKFLEEFLKKCAIHEEVTGKPNFEKFYSLKLFRFLMSNSTWKKKYLKYRKWAPLKVEEMIKEKLESVNANTAFDAFIVLGPDLYNYAVKKNLLGDIGSRKAEVEVNKQMVAIFREIINSFVSELKEEFLFSTNSFPQMKEELKLILLREISKRMTEISQW